MVRAPRGAADDPAGARVTGSTALSIGLALLAGAGNAAGNVLQRKASLDQGSEEPFSLRLLLDLVRRPVWVAGFSALVASFLLQAVALSVGELSIVEPIVAMELPLTLVLASVVFSARLGAREWSNFVLMTAGLVVLVAALSPRGGAPESVSHLTYAIAGGATAATIAVFFLASRRGRVLWRTAMLGLASGTSFGLTATMIKETTSRLETDGVLGVVSAWQTYTAVGFGLLGVITVQNALHVGPLVAAQPGFTLMDPVVALLWGILVFKEAVRGGWFAVLAAAGFAAIVAAVVQLSRSPLLEQLNDDLSARPGRAVTGHDPSPRAV